jgi:hypothetical protein
MLDVAIWFIEIVIWVRACMQESQEKTPMECRCPKGREMVGRKVEERSSATKLKQKKKTRKATTKGQHLMTSSVAVSNLSDVSKEKSGIA